MIQLLQTWHVLLFFNLHVTYISLFAFSLQCMSWFQVLCYMFSTLCWPTLIDLHSFTSGVALTLCQSDPVLNDGRSKKEQSREAVLDGVRKRFLEKVVAQHEDDDGSSSD